GLGDAATFCGQRHQAVRRWLGQSLDRSLHVRGVVGRLLPASFEPRHQPQDVPAQYLVFSIEQMTALNRQLSLSNALLIALQLLPVRGKGIARRPDRRYPESNQGASNRRGVSHEVSMQRARAQRLPQAVALQCEMIQTDLPIAFALEPLAPELIQRSLL